MGITAAGIGSGLDVDGIITKLMALEKQPLSKLQSTASSLQTRLSAFGQLKSQISNLNDQVAKLASTANWGGLTISSSNSAAITGSISNTALASVSSFSVEVSQLARAQSTASATAVPVGSAVGVSGTLTIRLGTWGAGPAFSPKTGSVDVGVSVDAADKLSDVASKINAANAGVTATVVTDVSGERLSIKSNSTGVENAFRIQVSAPALNALAYDPQDGTILTGMGQSQSALNTLAKINGVDVESGNNLFTGAVPGVSLTVSAVTTSAATVTLAQDKASITTYINNLVTSYNALSSALTEMTKYDPATKTAGTLQGDGTAVGLQGALRRMFSGLGPAGSSFRRMSDIGVEFQQDGTLKVNSTKLNKALESMGDLKTFFTASGASGAEGLAVRIKGFAQGVLDSTSGTLTTKNNALKSAIERNTKEQDRINDRIERTEARLRAQYSRLDTQLGRMSALNDYVGQQITAWNNQKSNG